jgi:hypothetical protein
VAEIKKKTGYNVVLHDPDNKLKDVKVTLVTGKTTFWEALEKFCAKAGVVEGDPNTVPAIGGGASGSGGSGASTPVPLPADKIKRFEKKKAADRGAAKPLVVAADVAVLEVKILPAADGPAVLPVKPIGPGLPPPNFRPRPYYPVAQGQITLIAGKAKSDPTDYSSSIRVRALPDNKIFGNASPKQFVFPLQLTPEPRLRWGRIVSVKIDKAIDNNDQKLAQAAEPALPGAGGGFGKGGFAPGGPIFIGGGPMVMPWNGYGYGLHQYTPVRLTKGEKASKSLKEISGIASVEIMGDAETLLVADDVLKGSGKTFNGKHGGHFKILGVTKADNGQVTIRYEMQQPTGAVAEIGPSGQNASDMPIRIKPLPGRILKPALPIKGAPAKEKEAKAKEKADAATKEAVAKEKDARAKAKTEEAKKAEKVKEKKNAKVAEAPAPAIVVADVAIAIGSTTMPYYPNNFGVTLRDEKGNVLPTATGINWSKGPGGVTQEFQMVYTPQKGQGKVSQLIFTGRRPVTVNVPFKLKDVKLP